MSDTPPDIETLFPDREIVVGGEKLTLKPFRFGQLPKAVKLLRPVTDAVGAAGIAGFDGKTFRLAGDWALRLPQIMDESGDHLLEFVAFATNKQRTWIDALDIDEGITLTRAIFEINGDFFVKRVAPKLGMSTPVETPPVETGAPSLPVSSAQDTPGATSSATH